MDDVKAIKEELKDLKAIKEELRDLQTLKDKLNNRDTHIMFSVYSNSGYGISEGSFLDFDYSWVENGYPLTNGGEFIAPVNGNYEFSITGNTYYNNAGTSCDSRKGVIQVLRNGVKIHEISANESNDYTSNNLSTSWIVTLNVGDSIRLYVGSGCIYTDAADYRTFSGKLIEVL